MPQILASNVSGPSMSTTTNGNARAGPSSEAGTGAGGGAGGTKRAITSRACDACRTRKLKCTGRPEIIDISDSGVAVIPCQHCREWKLECCYLYQRKRRGRRNLVVEKLAQEQRARRAGEGEGTESGSDSEKSQPTTRQPVPALQLPDFAPLPQPFAPATIPFIFQPEPITYISPPSAVRDNLRVDNPASPPLPTGLTPFTNPESIQPAQLKLDAFIQRELALKTISLYFDHVSSIIPVIHQPSFMNDLAAGEEERNPIFFALILSMISMTLIHIPVAYFPIPAQDVRTISDRCMRRANAITHRNAERLSLDMCIIKFFMFVVHNKRGDVGLEAATFGEAQYISICLGMHREDSYYNLNPIESQRRRRLWFMLFNADKFEAAVRTKPVLLPSDEFMCPPETTALPLELDDKCITMNGYLPPLPGTPLATGFTALIQTCHVLGDMLIHERDIRRNPPVDPESILAALKKVRIFQSRLNVILAGLPRVFQFLDDQKNVPAPGWEEDMRDELDEFFLDPTASVSAKDGYLVLRANIHVTMAMTRLRLILHRDDLLTKSGPPGTSSRTAAELISADLGEKLDWRHTVYQDLFKTIHGTPIQALAANGPSILTKIRLVAVTLLDAVPAQAYDDPSVQGMAAYLLDFLNIMTSIEDQFAD